MKEQNTHIPRTNPVLFGVTQLLVCRNERDLKFCDLWGDFCFFTRIIRKQQIRNPKSAFSIPQAKVHKVMLIFADRKMALINFAEKRTKLSNNKAWI